MKKLLTIFFLFSFLFINHCSKNEKIEIVEIKDDQIEAHKESLRIADLRVKAAEKAAERIKEEDEAEKKKAESALVEKEKKNRLN